MPARLYKYYDLVFIIVHDIAKLQDLIKFYYKF